MLSGFELPRYDDYKESGVEWLGRIPAEWEVTRLKFSSRINPPPRIGVEDLLNDACFLPMEVVHSSGKVEYGIQKPIKEIKQGFTSFQRNDVIMAKITPCFENGKGAYLDSMPTKYGFGSTEFHVLRVRSGFNQKYIYYLTKTDLFMNLGESLMTGSAGQKRVQTEFVANFRFAFPVLAVQDGIVRFLDKKTTQIDEAIAIKEQQIALLKERKQIIIQKAVTQGLDPTVPMKDSGVDWIGEIPAHWEVKRLKYVTKIVKRIAGYEGPDVLSITQKGIKIKDIDSGEGQLAMDYSKYQVVEVGDFAMNHMDLLTGYVDISKYNGVVSPDYRVFIRTYDGLDDEFLLAIFQLGYQQKIFYRYGQGVSLLGRWRFPAENFNNFFVPIPPKEEQKLIFRRVKEEWDKVDKGIALLLSQIGKLKEYKTTLINSAVTGKIRITPDMVEA
ncbi:restriction endonuclease subunit S [Alcanivorax profundi]|uniref:Restriction endonuclease subunit S n=2 Tax=Alcanivorax profundi TaxID=2338368 RepID=A0A418Y0I0_9GAMM|nr:restriction endonuclease subunit S [Alcanivorax profundi]